MVINLKVSRDFVNYTHAGLDEFGNGVYLGLNNNPAFPLPPVTAANVLALDQAFRDGIAGATGDPQDTAAMMKARNALTDALRKDASYVEIQASHDLQMLLSSGYYPASTNRAQYPLDPPAIQALANLATTKFLLRLTPVPTAKSYHVQLSADGGKTWQEGVISTQARRIVLTGLTPGTVYAVQARAIGGSTGCSEWCQPVSLMAT
jgi:hypothetical protein